MKIYYEFYPSPTTPTDQERTFGLVVCWRPAARQKPKDSRSALRAKGYGEGRPENQSKKYSLGQLGRCAKKYFFHRTDSVSVRIADFFVLNGGEACESVSEIERGKRMQNGLKKQKSDPKIAFVAAGAVEDTAAPWSTQRVKP